MQKKNGCVSVIVPVYNVEKYLDVCIHSIVNQTYGNLEIILIDDGSADSSGVICDRWKEKDNRIKVIHKENGGLSDARNVGIDNSTGEYLLFVDSDDYIHSELVEYTYNLLVEQDVDMVIFDFLYVQEKQNSVLLEDESVIAIDVEKVKSEDLLYQFIKSGKGHVVAWNKLYKKEVWDSLRFPVGKIHEDEFVIVDVINSVKTAVVSGRKLYYYRQRHGSIVNTKNIKALYDAKEAFQLRYEKVKDNKELYQRTYNLYLFQIQKIYYEVERKEKKNLLKEFRKVFQVDLKYTYWKTNILFVIFYISPMLYIKFVEFISGRKNVKRLKDKEDIR